MRQEDVRLDGGVGRAAGQIGRTRGTGGGYRHHEEPECSRKTQCQIWSPPGGRESQVTELVEHG